VEQDVPDDIAAQLKLLRQDVTTVKVVAEAGK
jgi:hypothetical protein